MFSFVPKNFILLKAQEVINKLAYLKDAAYLEYNWAFPCAGSLGVIFVKMADAFLGILCNQAFDCLCPATH